jgi:hypothetical protein
MLRRASLYHLDLARKASRRCPGGPDIDGTHFGVGWLYSTEPSSPDAAVAAIASQGLNIFPNLLGANLGKVPTWERTETAGAAEESGLRTASSDNLTGSISERCKQFPLD